MIGLDTPQHPENGPSIVCRLSDMENAGIAGGCQPHGNELHGVANVLCHVHLGGSV